MSFYYCWTNKRNKNKIDKKLKNKIQKNENFTETNLSKFTKTRKRTFLIEFISSRLWDEFIDHIIMCKFQIFINSFHFSSVIDILSTGHDALTFSQVSMHSLWNVWALQKKKIYKCDSSKINNSYFYQGNVRTISFSANSNKQTQHGSLSFFVAFLVGNLNNDFWFIIFFPQKIIR